ncbi:uncharacterized protein B0P05DRAFT_576782 [Gilbertella persicaria]|uniref:uncharacterized protein n=1 Tax=Gilbertella persicaria TaxID=101096 RepID=UPI00221F9D9C|nr:uncharacterized protein B0P05DRAFT_576782 [Gilbertella persicaria]KAI8097873.1 hypothetical protein B0P05DRAFT_576782 [Gilbertella persicaria]
MGETKPDYSVVIDQEPDQQQQQQQQNTVVAPSVIKLSPGMKAVLPIASYCAASILMTVTNKYVLSGYDFNMNFLLLTIQNLTCVVLLQSFKFLNLIKFRDFDSDEARKWSPIAAALVAMIYTGSKALQYLRIPIYTIFKNLTIILIAYGEVLWFGGNVTHLMLVSFGLMVLSSVIAGWADISDTVSQMVEFDTAMLGYFWMATNCLASAAFVLYMRKRIKLTNFKDFDTVYYNNLVSIPMLIIPSFIFEDWSAEGLTKNFPADVRQPMLIAMIFSGVSAFAMSYASAWCVRTTSSTTYSMVGALNKLPIAASGIMFFGDPATFGNVSAIIVGFIAGLVYSVAKTIANKSPNKNKDLIPMSSSSQSNADARKREKPNQTHRFRLSSTSGNLVPLQTIRQRLIGLWQSLTWPVFIKVIKANIAVTIALGLLLVDPVQELTGIGGILASVAVEFVHPTKSYGFLAEDVLFGSVMCSLSAAWSILAIYLASLVRDPSDETMAQTNVLEQANVGAMLAGTIMVIGMTSAVQQKEFSARPVDSTTIYVEHLIKLCETFDGFTQRQVSAFLRDNSRKLSIPFDPIESVASINLVVDDLITALVLRKRMVRREPSFNMLAPTDISEITSLVKKIRTPLQGLVLSRAMEENMRKAEEAVFQDNHTTEVVEAQPTEPATNLFYNFTEKDSPTSIPSSQIQRSRSYYGGTDDEDQGQDVDYFTTDDDTSGSSAPQTPSGVSSSTSSFSKDDTNTADSSLKQSRRRKVMSYWREDYDDVLNIVKPVYLDLSEACSIAIQESVKRLRHIQGLDPRYQDRPFFYKYYYRWKVGAAKEREESKAFAYDRKADPSVPLLKAIRQFQEHRLTGLNRLYTKSGVPRRILFLLLTFQFNLHTYAEQLYTLTSHIYELDQIRTKRRLWWPHIPWHKFFQSLDDIDEEFDLNNPAAMMGVNNPISLQRKLSRRATLLSSMMSNDMHPVDLEAQQSKGVLYKLNTPQRGEVHSPSEHHQNCHKTHQLKEYANPWRQNTLDPLEYHDPDVAYPTTSTQRFFYSIYLFFYNNIYSADVAFAFRAAIVVALLSLPAFLESSATWYDTVRGQWAVVVALIWMGPSVGSNFFGTMTRTAGTIIGAIQAIIIWEAGRGTPQGLIILSFLFNLPWWLVYIHGKFWKATGLFALVTVTIIIGYTHSFKPNGQPVSIFIVTLERMVSVIVGVFAALVISIFPYPRTGRVILRRRISQTLSEIGSLYSSFLSLLLKETPDNEAILVENRELFNSVANAIRRQIQGERVLLEQSRFEPALRGIFPEAKYLHILQVLENILSLIIEMEFSMEKIPYEWRMMITRETWKERKEMISSYLIALHLGSYALINKSPIPPYVIRPTKARRNLTNKARKLPALQFQHLGEREYTYFSSYIMNSEQLSVELELLIATIRDLVGPDSVSIWLNYKH